MSMNPPDIKPEIVDHNYALGSSEKDTGDQSSSDSNSSDSSSSSDSETEGVLDNKKHEDTEQKDRNVPVSTPIVPADGVSNTKSSSRTRTPPDKYVDLFAVTPKGSPSGRKSPKRLSTSVNRKAKEPLRRRQMRSEGGPTQSPYTKRGKGCGECEPCNREDCGKCVHCLDKVKYGGPGKRKQKCSLRVCVNMISKRKRYSNSVSEPHPITPKVTTVSKSPAAKKISASSKTPTASSTDPAVKATPPAKKIGVSSKTPTSTDPGFKATPLPEKTTPSDKLSATPSVQVPSIIGIADTFVKTMKSVGESVAKLVTKPSPIAPKPTPSSTSSLVTSESSSTKAIPSTQLSPIKRSRAVTAPVSSNVKPVMTATIVASPVTTSGKSTTSKVILLPADAGPSSKRDTSGWELTMKCVQCNRERKLSVARTPKFCTQRCIMQWLRDHPDKTPKDAVGDSNAPLFSLPALTNQPAPTTEDGEATKKPLSRALKNLHIDMAPPGTTLLLPAGDVEKNDNAPLKAPKTVKTPVADVNVNKKPRFSQPASSSAKRSVVTPQPSAIKKAKQIEKPRVESLNNSKSVKFDLSSTSSVASILTPPPVTHALPKTTHLPKSISIVPLDRLSEFVSEQQKKFLESATPKKAISIPKDLPKNIKDWTVKNVVTYFKSTTDCHEFSSVFDNQEVDGCALLQLTDEVLYRCLSLPLGRVVKIMAHVDELKKLAQN